MFALHIYKLSYTKYAKNSLVTKWNYHIIIEKLLAVNSLSKSRCVKNSTCKGSLVV